MVSSFLFLAILSISSAFAPFTRLNLNDRGSKGIASSKNNFDAKIDEIVSLLVESLQLTVQKDSLL